MKGREGGRRKKREGGKMDVAKVYLRPRIWSKLRFAHYDRLNVCYARGKNMSRQ